MFSNSKTHIIYFSQLPIFGGGEQYLVNLLNNISQESFRLSCICTYKNTLDEIKKRVDGQKVKFLFHPETETSSIWKTVWPLSKIISSLDPDILHCNGIDSYGASYAVLAAKLARIPVIIGTFHMSLPYPHYQILENMFRWAVDRSLDGAIAVSASAKENALKIRNLPGDKIKVIHNGIDLSMYPAHVETDHPAENQIKIGNVARLVPSKAVDIVLQAAQILHKYNPDIQFVVVGDGPERGRLVDLAARMGLNQAVLFLGWREDVIDLFQEFDIYVSSSLSEGFSLSTVEAMVSELPVVCTDVGGVSEVVSHGQTGFLVPANDPIALAHSIQTLVENPFLRKQMGEAGRARAEQNFSVERMVSQTQQYYQTMLDRKYRRTSLF